MERTHNIIGIIYEDAKQDSETLRPAMVSMPGKTDNSKIWI